MRCLPRWLIGRPMHNATVFMLDVLDRERSALLAADFSGLARVATAKESAFERLRAARLTEQALESVRRKITQNQGLLSAALSGVRDAAAQLSPPGPLDMGRRFQAYDHGGHRADLGPGPAAFRHKA